MKMITSRFRRSLAARRAKFQVVFKNLRALLSYKEQKTNQITVVMVGRNDDYMPNFNKRLLITLKWNLRLAKEAIFVEWNPPKNRPLLAHNLTKQFTTLRAYIVSPELHARVCRNSNLSMMEYFGKNVGIRRSHTDWVCVTNCDIMLGPDVLSWLASNDLSENTIYRAQRIDADWRGEQSVLWFLLNPKRYTKLYPVREYCLAGSGDFVLSSRRLWFMARGYDESLLEHRIHCDSRGIMQLVALGGRVQLIGSAFHLNHPTSCSYGVQLHHGLPASITEGIPYLNADTWGLSDCQEILIGDRIWMLR